MRKTGLWVYLVVVALGLLGSELSVTAKEQRPSQPIDYLWTEFLVGGVGSIVGGVAGGVVCPVDWGGRCLAGGI